MPGLLERAASETQLLTKEPWQREVSVENDWSIATMAGGHPDALTVLLGRPGGRQVRARLAPEIASARWLLETLGKVQRLLDLAPNWDGYGARPVDTRIVERALQFLVQVVPQSAPAPYVVPSPSGGLQIEWHEPGGDIELEFRTNGTVSYFQESDGLEVEETGSVAEVIERARSGLARALSSL